MKSPGNISIVAGGNKSALETHSSQVLPDQMVRDKLLQTRTIPVDIEMLHHLRVLGNTSGILEDSNVIVFKAG